MEDREKDIQELCKQVINVSPHYTPTSARNGTEYTCPFCYSGSNDDEMKLIEHKQECAYLIAKDLSTNH